MTVIQTMEGKRIRMYEFLNLIFLFFKEIRVSKNEIIFEKDDEDDDPLLYIINKGTIEIFVETDKGENEITLI